MKQGYFNHETLEVSFGGELSKPHNIFTAKAIKIPSFSFINKHKECLGNGWYSTKTITETIIVNNLYLIIKENKVIGTMSPYHQVNKVKSYLNPINENTNKYVLDFINENNYEI